MTGRTTAVAAIAVTVIYAITVAFAGASTPSVPGTAADTDYHAEGQIIGGNIKLLTDRAPSSGTALAVCDPDPRPAPHARPDDCTWSTPAGSGRDLVDFGRHIADGDESPDNAYTPSADPKSRESFKGETGFTTAGPTFDGTFYTDEDKGFTLTPRTLDAYLAPNGDANSRWRRFCGSGYVQLGDDEPQDEDEQHNEHQDEHKRHAHAKHRKHAKQHEHHKPKHHAKKPQHEEQQQQNEHRKPVYATRNAAYPRPQHQDEQHNQDEQQQQNENQQDDEQQNEQQQEENEHQNEHQDADHAPFTDGEVRKFVVELWDADFRDPSDDDGGNQDYWVIDILKPGSTFDASTCQAVVPPVTPIPPPADPPPTNPPPGDPGPPPVVTNPPVTVSLASTGGSDPSTQASSSGEPSDPGTTSGSQAPLLVVSAARVSVSASGANARGPGGCLQRAFNVAVRGDRILRVDFSLDGRSIGRVTKRDTSGLFRTKVPLTGMTRSGHRITARVAFFPGVAPRVRTLPISFQRCARAASAPAFAG